MLTPVAPRIESLPPASKLACQRGSELRRQVNQDRKEQFQALQALSFLGNIGFIVVAAVLLGWFVGDWLDRKLGTAPWLLLACLILSLVGAAVECWRILKRFLGPHGDDRTRTATHPPNGDR